VIGQISIESPLSTNQQSFYRHVSDSKPENLNLTFAHRYLEIEPHKEEDILFYAEIKLDV